VHRTVVLAGHHGAHAADVVRALVEVAAEHGLTAARPAEDAWGTALLTSRHGALYLVDATAGPPDETRLLLEAADAVAFVVAAGGGVDSPTVDAWHASADERLPRVVVLTGLDDPSADVMEAVAIARRVFDEGIAAAALPLDDDDGRPAGLLDLLDGTITEHTITDRTAPASSRRPAEDAHLALTADAREALVESILAASEDDALLDAHFSAHLHGGSLPPERLFSELVAGVAAGWLYPALPVDTSGRRIPAIGAEPLLTLLLAAAPAARGAPAVVGPDGAPVLPLDPDPRGALLAGVLLAADGEALIRIWSGTLSDGTAVCADGVPVGTLEVRSLGGAPPDAGLVPGALGIARLPTSGLLPATELLPGALLSHPAHPLVRPAASS